jgi:hypothetical protein
MYIKIHNNVGFLYVTTYKNDQQLKYLYNNNDNNLFGKKLNQIELKNEYPSYNFPINIEGSYIKYGAAG